MRAVAALVTVLALVVASCGVGEADVIDEDLGASSPRSPSPATTSRVATSPAASETPSTVAGTDELLEPTSPTADDVSVGSPDATVPVTTVPSSGGKIKPIQPVDPYAEGLVAPAIADLGTRLGVSQSEIDIVSVRAVTWPDGSIGCPQPGMSYTQALVSGVLVVLQVDGIDYEYHSGDAGGLFYCATPTPPVPDGSGDA